MLVGTIVDAEEIEKSLGTPSSQKIMKLLSCWDELPVKDIIKKTKLSESQVHITLKNLEKMNIIIKKTRGIYTFETNTFAQHLKQAYFSKVEEYAGNDLYFLTNQIDNIPKEEFFHQFQSLIEKWQPILEMKFRYQMAYLTEYLVDTFIE